MPSYAYLMGYPLVLGASLEAFIDWTSDDAGVLCCSGWRREGGKDNSSGEHFPLQ